MPSDYYMLISGVNGESQAADMAKNIELEAWDFDVNSQATVGGNGLSVGRPWFSDFGFVCKLDTASWQIMKNMCQGTHIATATFTGRKTGGDKTPYKFLAITLSNAFVTSFQTDGEGTGIPKAKVSLAFENVQFQYFTQDTKLGTTSLAGTAKYSIEKVQAG